MSLDDFSILTPIVSEVREKVRNLLEKHFSEIPHDLNRKNYEMQIFKDVSQIFNRKWSIEILWELEIHQEMSFSELQHHLKGISSRSLSYTLKILEKSRLISREVLSDRPPKVEYKLTETGKGVIELSILIIWFLISKEG